MLCCVTRQHITLITTHLSTTPRLYNPAPQTHVFEFLDVVCLALWEAEKENCNYYGRSSIAEKEKETAIINYDRSSLAEKGKL